MKEIGIEELRELQMQLLDYVDAFCRKHDIKYTISGGTLLGAIRHGGYIPWDDDMDIQMLREEYNKFTLLWNKEKSEHPYELVNIESGNSMGYPFGKIHNPKTVTYIGKLERTGIYIDLFPVDYVKDQDDFVNRHAQVLGLYKQRSRVFDKMRLKHEPFNIKLWYRILRNGAPHTTYNQIAEEINNVAMMVKESNSPLVYEMIAGTKCKNPIPTEVFKEYVDVAFENRKYMSVKDYDTYLTLTFGDYMTPPPAKERECHLFQPYWR